ncbi:Cof-type HAD-IIB family hydrolase [Paenibacillus agilis]|uniref:Cof-type HAD-IIB family hydrolase n=1 Tax=Paenibacillus agilis TaxID=3020863 RepID=A0A559IWT3_9BACL|nr:Cof-type HAD-IIB family hydrolase [Paenibacillus agilis]TVX92083.1 Cof-type HAD-IIB family hydrolase [Paenibacillus agilis]
MGYKIVFFDIDGTLVNDEKEIPQDAIEAIAELQNKGVEAVIATGRAPYFIKSLAEQLGIDSFVCLNGGYVVYQGKTIFKRSIPHEDVETLVNHAALHQHALVFEGESAFYSSILDHPFMLDAVQSLKVELPGHDPEYWRDEPIYQMFLHCSAEDEHLYSEVVPGLRYIRWHQTAMDVLPHDSSKAEGIQAMLHLLQIAPEEAIAFGDGLNDKEMLSAVGLGIAMGNSHEELLPYADYVTAHVNEGGIRRGLQYAGLID